jgi:hypothetical protein
MKHIKKKFQFEETVTSEQSIVLSHSENYIPYENSQSVIPPKNRRCFLITDSNKIINAFPVSLNGKHYYIPEPDPVLIYFNNAYVNYKSITKVRDQVYQKLNDKLSEVVINELYEYFGLTNGFIIFLFTTIEAFINRKIPENYNYTIVRSTKTEIYNNEQIQRQISFDDKLKVILKEVSSKNFIKDYPLKYQHIINLKEFRDSIVHTKANSKDITPYEFIYKKALNFKYEETLHAVRDFINYYEPKYVEECKCGADW